MTTGPLPDADARLLGIKVSRDAPDQVTAEVTAPLAERLDREDVYTVRVVAAVDARVVARLTARAATRIRQI